MKKLLKTLFIIHFSLFICALAHAKTAQELATEYDALRASGQDYATASTAVYEANKADVATIFESWKNSTSAKFASFEEPCKNLTDAQKKQSHSIRAVMSRYIIDNDKIIAIPARVAFLTVPLRYNAPMSVENPNWYEELKGKDFVVDGVKLPTYSQIFLAQSVKDISYIASLPIESGMCLPDFYVSAVVGVCLDASDLDAAKEKIRAVKNYIIRQTIRRTWMLF